MKKLSAFASTLTLLALTSSTAFAQTAGAPDNAYTATGWLALAAGLGLGIAAFGGAIGQGLAAKTALEGIARNPQAGGAVLTPLILSLALIEALVIYSLVIAFILAGKFPEIAF